MNKKKFLWITLIALALLMFGLIPLVAYLTDGKEISDFTPSDQVVFWFFIGSEIAVSIGMLAVAAALGKSNRRKQLVAPQPVSLSDTERILRRRSVALQILAGILVIAADFLGVWVGRGFGKEQRIHALFLAYCMPVTALLLGLFSYLFSRLRVRRFEHMDVAEQQQWLMSHREQAELVAEQKLQLLATIRHGTDAFAILVTLLGLFGAFCQGMTRMTDHMFPVLLAAMVADLGITRFRFPAPRAVLQEGFDLLEESEYPSLYALAARAAKAHGRKEPFRIGLISDCNASIGQVAGTDIIQLGVVLVNLLSEEELYAVLLHEYGHTGNRRVQKEIDYADWLGNMRERHFLGVFSRYLYSLPDETYSLQFSLFRFANAIGEEIRADRAMAELGDAKTAASALLKIKYEELYSYEEEALDHPDSPDIECLIRSRISGRLEAIRAAIRDRESFYQELVRHEIQALTASHPTQRARMENLGVSEFELVEDKSSEAYRSETQRALSLLEQQMIDRADPSDYASYHERLLKIVETWEASGRELQEESYPDTVGALKELGRLSEGMELCRFAIQELPEGSSKAYAEYMLGCCLLHQWNKEGIDRIYSAIESNNNYMQEGLDQIGSFCCLVGDQEQLDRYRERALMLQQQDRDLYSQISVLKKGDRLSGEELPEELKKRVLLSLLEIDQGQIEAAYLLHKQITADFFTSAMVVRFRDGISFDDKNDAMHRIFLCLDAVEDWQFSLFDYEEVEKLRPENIPGSLFYAGQRDEKTR